MPLIPHFIHQEEIERDVLLWQMDLYTFYQNQGEKPQPYATTVAMKDRWKMLADSLRPTELFDLEADHRELYNLLGTQSEKEAELQKAIEAFLAAPRVGAETARKPY